MRRRLSHTRTLLLDTGSGGAGCDDFTPGKQCPGMTDVEYKTEFTLWSISGASMLVATDVRVLSPLQREVLLNHELLAVNQVSGQAGGLVYRPLGTGTEVWMRELAEGAAAFAVFNPQNTVRPLSLIRCCSKNIVAFVSI